MAEKATLEKTKAPADPKPAAGSGEQSSLSEHAAELEEQGGFNGWLHGAMQTTPSWLVSLVFHMIVLLALALWALPQVSEGIQQLIMAPGDNEELDDIEELEDEILEDIDVEVAAVDTEVVQEEVQVSPADDMEAAAIHVDLSEFGLEKAPRNDLMATVGAYTGNGLSGRGRGKAGMIAKYGGTPGSEKAVGLALKWLANHQLPDGSWSFDHTKAPSCGGQCPDPGNLPQARNGATAIALLPFLGAGQTHKTGKYKQNVKAGLYYLVSHIKLSQNGGSMHEGGGRMYSHGLASIALCEAYAMTHDKGLHAPAQSAINFICYAQDPVGGGWRYEPQQAGDTSVVGWQIMALKSGHMAYLQVPPAVVKKAFTYLDGVAGESGATYGYAGAGSGKATSAIGLLCRMYLGWKKDNEALKRGIQKIGGQGPDKSANMYYNYYATQVMRHWEGPEWKKWNEEMRPFLVNSQAKGGHPEGSWHWGAGHGGSGGRLYNTAMAAMTLEVYYRHLPIYRGQAVEEDFNE